ncbi:MAG: hypothetical protein ABL927_10980 [Bdellovibrionales bacterium]
MADLNAKVKSNLCDLMTLLKFNQNTELGRVKEDKENGSFTIEFSGKAKGIDSIAKLLEALKVGSLIRDVPSIPAEIHEQTKSYYINQDLSVAVNKDYAKVIFTPNGEYNAIIAGLESAMSSVKRNSFAIEALMREQKGAVRYGI